MLDSPTQPCCGSTVVGDSNLNVLEQNYNQIEGEKQSFSWLNQLERI